MCVARTPAAEKETMRSESFEMGFEMVFGLDLSFVFILSSSSSVLLLVNFGETGSECVASHSRFVSKHNFYANPFDRLVMEMFDEKLPGICDD